MKNLSRICCGLFGLALAFSAAGLTAGGKRQGPGGEPQANHRCRENVSPVSSHR